MASNEELLEEFAYTAKQLGRAHAFAADICDRRSKMFAIPTIVLSCLVAASAMVSLGDFGKVRFGLDLTICILSISLAILTSMQQFLDYGGLAKKHADAAVDLAAIARRWQFSVGGKVTGPQVSGLEHDLTERLKSAPRVSDKLQKEAHETIQKEIEKAKESGQQQTQQQQQS